MLYCTKRENITILYETREYHYIVRNERISLYCTKRENMTMGKLIIDFDNETVKKDNGKVYSIGEPDGFALIGDAWLRSGWISKYVYSFTWLGRPIIQQPEDMFRIQELICRIKPDYIVEIGIAHGGSIIYHASLCSMIGNGNVIGIDIEIRPHNKKAIESHYLYRYITMFEGDSTNPEIIEKVKEKIYSNDTDPRVIVILDGDHTKNHVLQELNLYSQFVSTDSYIIACDGYIKELVFGGSRSEQDWDINNPKKAAEEFVKNNPNFILEEPKFVFNEGTVNRWTSYWTGGFIKRIG